LDELTRIRSERRSALQLPYIPKGHFLLISVHPDVVNPAAFGIIQTQIYILGTVSCRKRIADLLLLVFLFYIFCHSQYTFLRTPAKQIITAAHIDHTALILQKTAEPGQCVLYGFAELL
jgi:hypothetical protein